MVAALKRGDFDESDVPGGLFGTLQWRDVDLDVARLSVRQALVSVAYQVELSDVKTGSGRRTIDLDPGTIDLLRLWRIQRSEERRAASPLTTASCS